MSLRRLDELWARHVTDPGDLANRAVLADALTEAGDPRGELIALQLAIARGEASERVVARATELLAEHGKRWSAAFPSPKGRVQFRGGFPVRVVTGATGGELERAIDQPEWATVEELELYGPRPDLALVLPRLLARMPLLRVLIAGRDALDRLAGGGEVSRSIRTISGGGWLPADRVAFPNLAVVAGRWLTYHETAELAAAQRAAAALGLDALVHRCTLHVPQHIVEVVGSRGNGPPETRCAVVGTPGGLEQPGWYVRTWRDRDDALVGWRRSGWFETETARQILEPLAAVGIRRIDIAIPRALDTRHAREIALMRRAIEERGVATGRAGPIDILAPATVLA